MSPGPLAFAVFSVAVAAFPCAESASIAIGETFELKLGRSAALADDELVIRFDTVSEDSRCPKGEQCIAAGKVRVALEVTARGAAPVRLELGTRDGSAEAVVGSFEITLAGVEPYPVAGQRILPENYVASFRLLRL